ncbi:MAG: hypothetical protein K5829_12100 [Treponema sp.]|nr:hypothetical protein [Treponema sp.]
MKKILCLCFSSTLQRSISFDSLQLEKVNRSKYYRMDASGKAVNSARILAQLEKGCVKTFCPLGSQNKEEFIKLAEADGLNLFYVEIPGKTRECWTLLDRKAKTTTELVVSEPVLERNEDFIKLEEDLLTKILPNEIKNCDAVLLAGSRPGIWKENLYAQIAELCINNQKFFAADFIGSDLKITMQKTNPSLIKINDEEFAATFYPETKGRMNKEDLKAAIIQKSKELNNMIVITRGIESTLAANKGIFAECPVEKVEAVNTTACGDSFNAGFLYEYINSQDFDAALKKGSWCAARNAEKECPGTII